MFEGFVEETVKTGDGQIFIRRGGNPDAAPVLLLHGYPQTSAMWHGVAPLLARDFQVICADLRGYGRSHKPESAPDHAPYSKRAMAAEMGLLMQELGFPRFHIGAHDRGARVAHRLGLDMPDRVLSMVLLDIAPTREMYAGTSQDFAATYWHWFYLIQPYPMPERMIGHDPEAFWKEKCGKQAGGGNPFTKDALAEYLAAFSDPACIHATCEDYRAAATIDLRHDDEDEGRKLTMPLQVVWARRGVIEKCFDALALWRLRAEKVEGEAVDATHYMSEEIPEDIAQRMADFFARHSGGGATRG
ncbi:alpha/beta fold hydrolase [Paracoccus onubensis]|uniref:Alpha/beta hydrolase n=1 Tax=Paracoccus onubensis TaxID=1675788 RepID=A0A418T8Q1_9RHOB|nr:alpha/beta hydrolase [Paracoccus onubensis]RJE89506.1 alpha/beta hydrolase [Paracoccus onubensis]